MEHSWFDDIFTFHSDALIGVGTAFFVGSAVQCGLKGRLVASLFVDDKPVRISGASSTIEGHLLPRFFLSSFNSAEMLVQVREPQMQAITTKWHSASPLTNRYLAHMCEIT